MIFTPIISNMYIAMTLSFCLFQCKELYNCIKGAMERGGVPANANLGGEFPVAVVQDDMTPGEGGLLQVCLEGVGLLFANSKVSDPASL